MNPTRLLERLLGAATLAATGVSAETAAADLDDLAPETGEQIMDREGDLDEAAPGKHAPVVRRRALARALSHPFSCAGAVTAIEVLVKDPDAMVRSAAKQAALLRLGHDPERYAALLEG